MSISSSIITAEKGCSEPGKAVDRLPETGYYMLVCGNMHTEQEESDAGTG
jgi:hypothetical protein